MGLRWLQFCFALCLIAGALSDAGEEFPALDDLLTAYYQTEVQFTNKIQDVFAYATEYYNSMEDIGRMDMVAFGEEVSVYYYNESNEILEVDKSSCLVWNIDESIYTMKAIFYGWRIDKPKLVIGPSALLWYAFNNKDNVKFMAKDEKVRDIPCKKFSLEVINENDNVTISYYFAPEGWITPYQYENKKTKKNLTIPIRITVIGESSTNVANNQKVSIDYVNDFIYFKPTIDNWLVFQPPLGIGCNLRHKEDIPDIPNIFRYSAEVHDLYKQETTAQDVDNVEFQQVWYHGKRKMARLDKYASKEFVSELYDFNTGTTYSIKNLESCTMKGLRDSDFEGFDSKFIGHMKEPGEVLNLKEGKFYSMGKRHARGMKCDTFEAMKQNVLFGGETYDRLVITVFYTETDMRVGEDGETMDEAVPVQYLITGWNNTSEKVVYKTNYNILGFDDIIWPSIHKTFEVEMCFPQAESKSYFVLFFNASEGFARFMEANDNIVIKELQLKITNYSNINDLRLPMLKADYKTSGVYVTGLMLERPPMLLQFIAEDTTPTYHIANDEDVSLSWSSLLARTAEDCAISCINENSFTCKGFFFCGTQCFLKRVDILQPVQDDKKQPLGMCLEYVRDEQDSDNKRNPTLAQALKDLKTAVMNGTIFVELFSEGKRTTKISAIEIIIGAGPNSNQEGGLDKPYMKLINNVKFDKNDENVESVEYLNNERDCYKSCKTSESIECSSFSYCPGRTNECLISSNLITDRVQGYKYTVDATGCSVFSMQYLNYFTPLRGRVPLVNGDDVVNNVKSPEECAKSCRTEKKFTCRGFEYCRSQKQCTLHSKHILDLKPGQISTRSNPCSHYAAKFSADYIDTGFTLIHDPSDKRTEMTLEQCARICSEEQKGRCKSFNYCPASDIYAGDSSCSLSSKLLRDLKVTTTEDGRCRHYEKRDSIDDWDRSNKKNLSASGYTSSGFSWLVVGMLFLGLVIGALGFVFYSYMKSRSGGGDSTVRFVKA